jgi:hypothetical protein
MFYKLCNGMNSMVGLHFQNRAQSEKIKFSIHANILISILNLYIIQNNKFNFSDLERLFLERREYTSPHFLKLSQNIHLNFFRSTVLHRLDIFSDRF